VSRGAAGDSRRGDPTAPGRRGSTRGGETLDFGIAKLAADGEDPAVTGGAAATTRAAPVTAEGTTVGTLHYMAPEQIRGEAVDERTDVFATGALMFEMIMGSRAFEGRARMEVYHRTLYEQPQTLGGSPAAVAADRVVRRALAKKPEDRFPAASDMAAALRGLREFEDTGAARAHAITRLIVLPFRVLRPDPATDFLAVSLPDAITCAASSSS
jgi:serine/threonine protein kinase